MRDNHKPYRNNDSERNAHREALHQIRQQLIDKIRQRYDVSTEEAERRLRMLEREG